jgi:hypothetical protein
VRTPCYSGCVHSSFAAVTTGPILPPDSVTIHSSKLLARLLLLNIRHHSFPVTAEEMEALTVLSESILNAR